MPRGLLPRAAFRPSVPASLTSTAGRRFTANWAVSPHSGRDLLAASAAPICPMAASSVGRHSNRPSANAVRSVSAAQFRNCALVAPPSHSMIAPSTVRVRGCFGRLVTLRLMRLHPPLVLETRSSASWTVAHPPPPSPSPTTASGEGRLDGTVQLRAGEHFVATRELLVVTSTVGRALAVHVVQQQAGALDDVAVTSRGMRPLRSLHHPSSPNPTTMLARSKHIDGSV